MANDGSTITIKGIERLIESFKQAEVELPEEFGRAMVASAIEVRQTAQALAPVKTGALRQSITESVEYNPLIGRVEVGQSYGRHVEYGTAARTITPIRAKALAFSAGGSMVFATSVNHPGTRAQPFLNPALTNNFDKIFDNFRRAAVVVLSRIRGA